MFFNTYIFCDKKYVKRVKYKVIGEDLNNYHLYHKGCFSIAINKKYEGKIYSIGYIR